MLSNSTILLIRHAEKPGTQAIDATRRDQGLSPAGQARAHAYVQYFETFKSSPIPGSGLQPKPAVPDFVFATKDSSNSHRPRLTVTPFAHSAMLPINTDFSDEPQSYCDLVTELYSSASAYDQKTILICWHHATIIDLANRLLKGDDIPPPHHARRSTPPPPNLSALSCWPVSWPDVFGWLLQIAFDGSEKLDPQWVRCLNENLMPVDHNHGPCKQQQPSPTNGAGDPLPVAERSSG